METDSRLVVARGWEEGRRGSDHYGCRVSFRGDENVLKLEAMMGLPWWLSSKESACNAGDLASIPGLGRSLGGGHGNRLQYSGLENPMGRGTWQTVVHRITQSWTRLKQLTSSRRPRLQREILNN